jgi:hypothetical protein
LSTRHRFTESRWLINLVPETEGAKRPKLEQQHSAASSGTASSSNSQLVTDTLASRALGVEQAAASHGASWQSSEIKTSQPPSLPELSHLQGIGTGPNPSNTNPSLSVLPGYRDSMFPVGSQTPSMRDVQREETPGGPRLPGLANILDGRTGYVNSTGADEANMAPLLQHAHRTRPNHPPSLLTSNSNGRPSLSSAGSSYFPHTPLEPAVSDRALPLPLLYSQKSSGSGDSQFSSLQPPSLSPQSTLSTQSAQSTQSHPQHSPSSKFAPNAHI